MNAKIIYHEEHKGHEAGISIFVIFVSLVVQIIRTNDEHLNQ
jgi:hypothetical protein